MTEKMITVINKKTFQQSMTTMRTTDIDAIKQISNIPETTSVIYCYFIQNVNYYLFINLWKSNFNRAITT